MKGSLLQKVLIAVKASAYGTDRMKMNLHIGVVVCFGRFPPERVVTRPGNNRVVAELKTKTGAGSTTLGDLAAMTTRGRGGRNELVKNHSLEDCENFAHLQRFALGWFGAG